MQDRINIGGTRNMVKAALAHKASRFVHTSSIAAYGFQPGPVTEQSPSTALTARINYFRSKRKAELEVHQGIAKGLDAVILNPAKIVGRHGAAKSSNKSAIASVILSTAFWPLEFLIFSISDRRSGEKEYSRSSSLMKTHVKSSSHFIL